MSERYRGTVRAPDFPAGMEWLNVERPLSLAALRGKVVLIDFWTFCCINCMHVLPRLRRLEARFPNELVVVGVHSAKFPAEGETYNLRQAVMRLGVSHPVVNDRHFVLWRAYATRAWPTLVVIDPEGRVVGVVPGEFDGDAVGDMIAAMVAEYDAAGAMDRAPLRYALEKQKQPDSLLSFPGKVLAIGPEAFPRELDGPLSTLRRQGALFVADTDHHRVLVFGREDCRLRAVYGSGSPGLTDGLGTRAQFNSPQGLALDRAALIVADTENHALRRVALETGMVTLLAGTGAQAQPAPVAGPATQVPLNSPWDVVVDGSLVYIAMAGSHQIWTLHRTSGALRPFAGDGHEALLDGPAADARLAQPSGLTVDRDQLWFADSETSSVRSVHLDSAADTPARGVVKTWIGHGLFEFGDADGDRQTGRLQHPLGIAAGGERLYLADSYNNKIKAFDPATRQVRGFAGSGEPGMYDGPAEEASFWEPGGLSASDDKLYIADTNNHAIRTVDLETAEVQTMALRER